MANKTKIEWTDYTSNGVSARRKGISYAHYKSGWFCDKPDKEGGCPNCYAEAINLRFGNGLKFDKGNRDLVEFTVRAKEQSDLLKLNDKQLGAKVFIGDMFDLFQPSIPTTVLNELFDVYEKCTNLSLQFLTKYTARMATFLNGRYAVIPEHFWLGMSAATQHWYDKNIAHLRSIDGRRFISFEPLVESVKPKLDGIGWVIIGGESGNRARPCEMEWIRNIISECRLSDTAVFVKQVGSRPITEYETDGHWQLVIMDSKGGLMDDWPEDIRIREFPK